MVNHTMNHDKIKLAQIYYNDETRRKVKTALAFDGSKANEYLENFIIAREISGLNPDVFDGEYIGILSARFEDKLHWRQSVNSIAGAIEAIESDGYSADVYSFFKSFTTRNVWTKAEQWQPGILEIAQILFKEFEFKSGVEIGDITQLETPIVYQNAFIARKGVYFDYVNSWLIPLIEIMHNNKQLKPLLMQDAKYQGAKLNKAQCSEVFGVPHYTFHPFVCERFFSTYLAINSEITLKHI